jgi:hypothetical protein
MATYRKNGTAVATPIWHVVKGGELFVVTEADTGKVKRIRNNSNVMVTVCDFRGRIALGLPSATGTARLLDDAETRIGVAVRGDVGPEGQHYRGDQRWSPAGGIQAATTGSPSGSTRIGCSSPSAAWRPAAPQRRAAA